MEDIKTYDDIEVTESEVFGTPETEEQAPTDQQEQDVETSEESTDSNEASDTSSEVEEQSEKVEEPEYVFTDDDGNGFTIDEINTWKEDSQNKTKWQKSNTQSAQELASNQKAIQPFLDFVEKVKGDNEKLAPVLEYVKDEYGEEVEQLFKDSMTIDKDKVNNPFKEELNKVVAEKQELEAKVKFDELVSDFAKESGLKGKKLDEVVEFTTSHFEETGRLLSFDEGHKILKADQIAKEVKKKPTPPTKVRKSQGAKAIETKQNPSKPGNYEDIDVSGFNLFG